MGDGMGGVEFRVLGPLDVRADGVDLTPGSAHQRRILTVLLLRHGDVVPTDQLLDVLWGDRPPATALKTFRTYLSRLRRLLETPPAGGARRDGGQPLIATRSPGYQLVVPRDSIDAHRFESLVEHARAEVSRAPRAALEQLERALGLWRGPAFAEFAHEEFARAEAARLEELRLAATEDRLEALLGVGADARVAAEAASLSDAHPLRERPRAQLMRALYRAGRQSEALKVYQDFRELLAQDLGVDPSPALRELQRDILRQRLVAAPSSHAGGGHNAGSSHGRDAWSSHWHDPGSSRVPVFQTRFVGREPDLAALPGTMTTTRLLTVLGVGGVGKTRLVAELARREDMRPYGRSWWCDLTEVGDDAGVAAAVAAAVGAQEGPRSTMTDAVVSRLGSAPTVLILDNCEHVAAGAAAFARDVLERCPGTRILATSRVRLGVEGERVHAVSPLPVPGGDQVTADDPAVALFVDRATAVRPDFTLAPDRAVAVAVAELCRRLDGLPLAIELAAARMGSLNLVDIDERLHDRFRFLASTQRTASGRHRTLSAVMDWSYGMLSQTERSLFQRLSVFAGGFTAGAAEAVCAGGTVLADEVVPLLGRLADASMVAVGSATGRARYHLLETLRDYGKRRLHDEDDARRWEEAHSEHFLRAAELADRRVAGPEEAEAVAEVDAELGNLRAVHRRAITSGQVDTALRLSVALCRYAVWRLRDEVFRWADEAVIMTDVPGHPMYGPACGVAAWGAALRGERESARDLATRALALLGPHDPRALRPREVLMHLALWEGRLDDCLEHCRRAEELTDDPAEFLPRTVRILALAYAGRTDDALEAAAALRPAADRAANPTMNAVLAYATAEALAGRDPLAAIDHCQRASELAAPAGNRMILGVADVTLASLHARHGDTGKALPAFRTVISHLHRGSDWSHLWTGLRGLVELLTRAGEHEAAGVLHGAVTGASTAPPLYGEDAERMAALSRTLSHALGTEGLAAARRRGRAMPDHEAVLYALEVIDAALRQRLADPPAGG